MSGKAACLFTAVYWACSLPWLGLVTNIKNPFFDVGDFVAPFVPIGLMFGRIGNFIGGELWGRIADPASVPWAMVFPRADLPRHPSQLYQAMGEGLLLLLCCGFIPHARAHKKPSALCFYWAMVFAALSPSFSANPMRK